MNFLEKLDYLIRIRGINKSVLSKESGVPYTTIDGFYKKGYEKAKLPTIQKIANYFDVTLDYLMRDDINDCKTHGFKIEFNEIQLIKNYRSLTPSGKETVDKTIDSVLEYEGKIKPHRLPNAAHEIEGATEEQKQHDEDIIDDDNF
jgi:hypothetical protein